MSAAQGKSKERREGSDSPRKPRAKKKRADGRRCSLLGRIAYWSLVLGLWGFIGVFLAVPTLVMFKIFCDHIEPLAPIGEFLGS